MTINTREAPHAPTARTLLAVMEPAFKVHARMTLRQFQTFLLVAAKPGQSVDFYAKQSGISPTTMSRQLLDLSDRNRKFEDGLGLLIGEPNLLDRREASYRLSSKGLQLLTSIVGRIK